MTCESAEQAPLSAAGKLPAEEERIDVVDDKRRGARGDRDVAARAAECRLVDHQVVRVVQTGREPKTDLVAAAIEPAQLAAKLQEIRVIVPGVVQIIDDHAALQAPIDAAEEASGNESLIARVGRQEVAVEVALRPVGAPLIGQAAADGQAPVEPLMKTKAAAA